jgi:hypothetical protein
MSTKAKKGPEQIEGRQLETFFCDGILIPDIGHSWNTLNEEGRVKVFGKNYWKQGVVVNKVKQDKFGVCLAVGMFHGGHPFFRDGEARLFTTGRKHNFKADYHYWGVNYYSEQQPLNGWQGYNLFRMNQDIAKYCKAYQCGCKHLIGIQ